MNGGSILNYHGVHFHTQGEGDTRSVAQLEPHLKNDRLDSSWKTCLLSPKSFESSLPQLEFGENPCRQKKTIGEINVDIQETWFQTAFSPAPKETAINFKLSKSTELEDKNEDKLGKREAVLGSRCKMDDLVTQVSLKHMSQLSVIRSQLPLLTPSSEAHVTSRALKGTCEVCAKKKLIYSIGPFFKECNICIRKIHKKEFGQFITVSESESDQVHIDPTGASARMIEDQPQNEELNRGSQKLFRSLDQFESVISEFDQSIQILKSLNRHAPIVHDKILLLRVIEAQLNDIESNESAQKKKPKQFSENSTTASLASEPALQVDLSNNKKETEQDISLFLLSGKHEESKSTLETNSCDYKMFFSWYQN
jgi:hypothetical protein